MYQISIDEIVDYSKCPMYYFFKYKQKASTDKIDVLSKYEEDLKKVVYYSFCKMQEGEFIRVEDIKQMWGKLWVKDKRKTELVFSDSSLHKDTYNVKRIKGLESLLSFKDYLADNKGFPIAINQEYKIRLDDMILTGKFEVVREIENSNGEKQIQVCLFKTDRDVPKLTNRYDMKFHCDALAIERMVEKDLKPNGMIYYLEKGKIITKSCSSIERQIFLHNIRTVASLIRNNVFYMSVNSNCQSCIYKDICGSKANTRGLLDKGE